LQTTDDIDLSRYPPTPDDLAAGLRIASREPAIQPMEVEYGQTALISAFLMLGDILTAFGLPEEALVRLARQAASHQARADAIVENFDVIGSGGRRWAP
jgi:hypothetical protein